MVESNNVFVGESGTPVVGGSVREPSDFYGYSLQNASDIKTIVMQGAGVREDWVLMSVKSGTKSGDRLMVFED